MKSLDMTKYVVLGYQLESIDQALDAVTVVKRALDEDDSPLASVLSLAYVAICDQVDAIRKQGEGVST